jgi:AmmeMemoRadiSam system protein B
MTHLRSNFSGTFYPANPHQLSDQIQLYLDQANRSITKPIALLVPHAGIIYSGPTAGFAYKQIAGLPYERVIILAPSHQIYHTSLAIPDAIGAETPLGPIQFDIGCIASLCASQPFVRDNSPHLQEHSIEVQYPFLQIALKAPFQVIPISVGAISNADKTKGAQLLAPLLDEKTLLVISTDLSHFHNQKTAEVLDRTTIQYILTSDANGLMGSYQRKSAECCGLYPIMLGLAILNELPHTIQSTLLHYDTSATTSLDNQRVVGYASIGFS